MMEIKEFKIRCSAISDIMTNPRSKSEILSQTCITHLEDWLKYQIYGHEKVIKSKYMAKGSLMEDTNIEYYSFVKNIDFISKNDDFFSDDFFCGTPDLLHDFCVYDFKTSWDCYTFPLFETEPDKSYWMQLQGYMHLTGLRKAKLVFTLLNTPPELSWATVYDYSEVNPKYRIKEFEFEYDPEFIEQVKERVLICRDYINKIKL